MLYLDESWSHTRLEIISRDIVTIIIWKKTKEYKKIEILIIGQIKNFRELSSPKLLVELYL